jgi:hypothetical protein
MYNFAKNFPTIYFCKIEREKYIKKEKIPSEEWMSVSGNVVGVHLKIVHCSDSFKYNFIYIVLIWLSWKHQK